MPMEIFWQLSMDSSFSMGAFWSNDFMTASSVSPLFRHEVRQIYPNKYITGDDRIYVFYTLFNLPGKAADSVKWSGLHLRILEIYLIACLVDFFSNAATYLKWVWEHDRKENRSIVYVDFSDRTGVIFCNNILSFRAIFNDVRNSIDRVHHRVSVISSQFNLHTSLLSLQGKLKEMVCESIETYIHKDEQLPVLLDR